MNFLQDKIFLEKRNNHQHYFFNVKADKLTLSWETVVNCLNFNIINNLFIKELTNFGLVLLNYNNISIIKEITCSVWITFYFNFMSKESTKSLNS